MGISPAGTESMITYPHEIALLSIRANKVVPAIYTYPSIVTTVSGSNTWESFSSLGDNPQTWTAMQTGGSYQRTWQELQS